MPKVRRSRKRPPEGWELIEPTLDELDQKLREGKLVFIEKIDLDAIYFQLKRRLTRVNVK